MKIVIKVLRWLAALVATVVGLAIVPVVLVRAPSPLDPDRGVGSLVPAVMDGAQVYGEAIVSVLVGLAWLAWLWLVVAFVVEAVVALTGAVPRELPGFGLGQAWVRPVIAALMWSSAASSMAMSVVGTGALSTLMSEAAAAQPFFDLGAGTSVSAPRSTSEPVELGDGLVAVDGIQARRHVVEASGVTMWDLADRHLGNPFRWSEIADLNLGRAAVGSATVSDPDHLEPGSVLLMPADAVDLTPPEPPRVGAEAPLDTASRISSITVEPGDNMWSLTEQVVAEDLGRTPSEAEIAAVWVDTVADNQDRIASGNPDLIYPGERISVPGSGPIPGLGGLTPVEAEAGSDQTKSHTGGQVGDDDHDQTVDSTGTDATVVIDVTDATDDAKTDRPVDDGAEVDAAVGGADPVESTDPAPVTVSAPTATATHAPAAPADDRGSLGQVDRAPRSGSGVAPLALSGFGAACLAAGIRGAILRRRDLQRRSRRPLTMTRPPSSAAAAFEVALAHAASSVVESRTGAGWRVMSTEDLEVLQRVGPAEFRFGADSGLKAESIDGRDKVLVDLDAVTGDDSAGVAIDLRSGNSVDTAHLAAGESDEATEDPGFAPSEDAPAVVDYPAVADDPVLPVADDPVLPVADDPVPPVADDPVPPVADEANPVEGPKVPMAPTSVLVGTSTDTGEAVFVDIASAQMVALRGDRESVGAFARTAVVDLATSNRADDLSVVAVAGDRTLSQLDRVTTVDTYDAARRHVADSGLAGASTPVVVVAGAGPPDQAGHDAVERLVDLGVGIIAPGIRSATAIEFDGERARIAPDGSIVQVASLDDDQYASVSELVEATSANGGVPVDPDSQLAELEIVGPAECPVEAAPVEVMVLGPVMVQGAEPFSSLKAVGVIAYLAFHRNGVDADQIKSWVWPAFEPPTDKAFANVMSRARTGLGVDAQGEPLLSRAGSDRTYRLSAEVTTDFERFCRLQAMADDTDDRHEALANLLHAVGLIRGVPFTGASPAAMAWADNHVRGHVEFTIDEAVHRCADLALELGDSGAARYAVRKGLELVPGCEECFRRRFLAAAHDQNRDELRRAMSDLERASALDLGEPEGVDLISPTLLALFEELDQRLANRPGDLVGPDPVDAESDLVVWVRDQAS